MRNRSTRNSALDQPNSTEGQSDRTTSAGSRGRLSNAALEGLKSECAVVWFDRVVYERAESMYYTRLQERPNGTTAPASSTISSRNKKACYHVDQEACHHVNQAVRVNEPDFDQAESNFVGRFPKDQILSVTPRSLPLQATIHPSQTPCDEGYQSQTPTPPTPASKPINGLPCLQPPLIGVWLQKPLFDRAEASYYQNMYSRNQPPANNEYSNSERRNDIVAIKTKPAAIRSQQNSDDVPANQGSAQYFFLHADSERVWLDRGRFVEAETRFYEGAAARSIETPINHSSNFWKKYDSVNILERMHTFHALFSINLTICLV
ncbi:eukaryotic translation elongation factor 1 delta b (guanine nucleotide exchange protein) isoform X1 [Xyrauchen texanus]|uniref:eukaryotic translation elongation factor 1 delta b (guanine nucleotide exchange protein) isoform X1 n=1 Tax=Xyrauchen texanus TaxID=154827 RepID=UPI002241F23D|nr:eukaryotic translation elongation factor 1 delta b (guanine nucleotide exchange protein) isoform X1 [Xyrauchen texanus]XP_051951249.1 eukaryotic translation elongation factor 1 delta b (guanine nucleotide exchange protein) isoform X1 [Xyrauchen texanus]